MPDSRPTTRDEIWLWRLGAAEGEPNLDRVEQLRDASHWVHHDEPERVTQLLVDFFAPAR
jgi:pimeloyl-ACP methyl ester carboxylesterase